MKKNSLTLKYCFSSNHNILAFGNENDLIFYNYLTKEKFIRYSHEQKIVDLTFSETF